MENVKNYTLDEYIGLYDRYLALRRAANDNNYELEKLLLIMLEI